MRGTWPACGLAKWSAWLARAAALVCLAALGGAQGVAAEVTDGVEDQAADEALRQRCLRILREGLRSEEFWPAMHAAEALTLAGLEGEVRSALEPRLAGETDDQRRCGLARELVRAGDRSHVDQMLKILESANPHGHVHAAESLYKVFEIGDGQALRAAMQQTENVPLRLMAAGALGRSGSPAAMRPLREALRSDQADTMRISAWLLGIIGDKSDVIALRANVERAEDPLVRAYQQHALAVLGDAQGQQALLRNLESPDAAIRTYAANFAGDARLTEARQPLIRLLDDTNLDVRLRAAQSLIMLAQPAPPDPREDISRLVYEADQQHPRYTEGSVIALRDGSLLFAITQFTGSGSDFAQARIVARESRDQGRSWGPPRVLQENTGQMNVMSVTLRRLRPPGTIGMFYLRKNAYDDLQCYVRLSHDECATFGEPIRVTVEPGYHVVNNDRVTQLRDGRLVVPVAATPDVRQVNHFVSFCYLSDDGGATWRKGQGQVDLPKRGAMEPEVIELVDGRLMMIMRNQLGTISRSYSRDRGDTWSEPDDLGLPAPEAPATLRRIPATGDLLLIWNDTYTPGAGHGGRRTPLTAAISSDEGRSWRRAGKLESDPQRTYAYTSVTFHHGRAVLSYWESPPNSPQLSTRFRSLPVSWFYEAP
ncbi:MAG: exo-alpha-sialidase [Pirellulaceae bacterium]|nr:exo-alpha-sialidase [Pirellulaceae bacterium]